MRLAQERNARGFTLLEVVLAMAISIVVFALVARAIELYLVRFDESRCLVEANQLARGLVDQIAADLRAVRMSSTATSSRTSSQQSAQGGNGNNQGGSGSGGGAENSGGGVTAQTSTEIIIRGLYGDATRLRIDRAAAHPVTRRFLGEEALLAMQPDDLPQSVTYFYREGRQLTPTEFASMGVETDRLGDCAGLCVLRSPTDAAVLVDDPLNVAEASGVEQAELIAPEVLELTFSYFDGEELRETWDCAEEERLPSAVQVELRVLIDRDEEPQRRPGQSVSAGTQFRPEDILVQQVWLEVPSAVAVRSAEGPRPRQTQEAQTGGGQSSNQGGSSGNASDAN